MKIYNKDTHKTEEINLYPENFKDCAEAATFYELVENSANATFNEKKSLYEMSEEDFAYYRPIAENKAKFVWVCEKYGIDYDTALLFAVQYDYIDSDDDLESFAHFDAYEVCDHIRAVEEETGEDIWSVITR